MSNNVILVGRLVANAEVKITDSGKKSADIVLAVNRSLKNEEGIYETDFIDCRLYGEVAEQTSYWCKKGDIVGVRGRLETYNTITEDNNKQKHTIVIAERITFLSSKHVSVEEEEDDL